MGETRPISQIYPKRVRKMYYKQTRKAEANESHNEDDEVETQHSEEHWTHLKKV